MKAGRKALVVATVGRFLNFEKNDMKILKELGYEVHCAANFCVEDIDAVPHIEAEKHQIDFARSPFSIRTLTAFNQIKKLLSEEHFDLIHCHTPVGGILTRLAARKYRNKGTKVFYTAHGFHFFEGAPIANWLLFYPIEWLCSWWTDVLLTINQEDYKRVKEKFHAKKTVYIPGVGIDLEKFQCGMIDKEEKRATLGLQSDDKMLLSVGELSERKNHATVIQALAKLNDQKIKYYICGQGVLQGELEKLIREKHLESQVFLLGYRSDVSELCQCADVFVFPSLQEGLPVALMEAIACKIPVLCSDIRGNIDLVKDEKYLFRPNDATKIARCIEYALTQNNRNIVEENYKTLLACDLTNVVAHMNEHYKGIFEAGGNASI